MTNKQKPFLVKPWSPFEHKLRASLTQEKILSRIQDKKILVACSGGVDSVALLFFLYRIQQSANLNLHVLHIHHGDQANQKFRDLAESDVCKLCQKLNLQLTVRRISIGSGKESETFFRQQRIQIYQQCLQETNADFLALGHHRDDLLETRFMRLFRGTGIQGLKAMSLLRKKVLRPFLHVSKIELVEYLNMFKLQFRNDPTNRQSDNVRNWIRNHWLGPLLKDHPDWHKNISRSLEQIAGSQSVSKNKKLKHNFSLGIQRAHYDELDRYEQKKIISEYVQSLGIHDFRHSQIEEIIKQLDRTERVHTFVVAGLNWVINAQQILAKKKDPI